MAISITQLRVEAVFDASGYTTGANQKSSADTKMVSSGAQLAASLDQTDRRLTQSAAGWDRFVKVISGATPEQLKFEAGQKRINGALDAGKITATEHTRLMGLLQQQYVIIPKAANDAGTSVHGLASAHTALSTQGMEAFHVMRSMTEQMAIGTPITQVLAQHMSQLSYAASGSGGLSGAFGEATAVLKGFITPTTLALAGTALLAGGVLVLFDRFEQNQASLRSFNLALGNLGPNATAAAASLQAGVSVLRGFGVSLADARTAMGGIARNPSINPAFGADLATVGANLAAVQGVQPEAGVKTLTDALNSGADAMVKLGLETRQISTSEAAAILIQKAHGDAVGATNRAYIDLKTGLVTARLNMGPVTEAADTLRGSWNGFLDSLSSTRGFAMAHEGLVQLLTDLTNLIEKGKSPQGSLLPTLLSAIPGMGLVGAGVSAGQLPLSTIGAAGMAGAGMLPKDQILGLIERFESGSRNILQQIVSPLISTAGGYFQITNSTWRDIAKSAGIDTGQYPTAMSAPYDVQRQGASTLLSQRGVSPWAPYNPRLAAALAGAGGSPVAGGGLNGPLVEDPNVIVAGDVALKKYNDTLKQQLQIASAVGPQQRALTEYFSAYNAALDRHETVYAAMDAGNAAFAGSLRQVGVEFQKEVTLADLATQGVQKIAAAYLVSESAGLKAAAAEQARIAVLQSGGDVQTRSRQILETQAAGAIQSSTAALPGLARQAEATQRLADAAKIGTEAQHEAELQNQVTAATQDALTKANNSGNQALIDQANAAAKATEALLRHADANQRATQQSEFARGLDFERQQLGRSADEASVYSRLRGVPGALDNAGSLTATGETLASQLRLNSALTEFKSISGDAAKSFVHDLMAGKTAAEALGNALQNISAKLADKAIDTIISLGFKGLTASIGTGGLFHTGGIVGLDLPGTRMVASEMFRSAPRYHTGGILPGEYPIIAKGGEGIFTPAQMKALGSRSAASVSHTVNISIGDIGNGMSRQEIMTSLHRTVGGAIQESNRQLQRNFGALAANARATTG